MLSSDFTLCHNAFGSCFAWWTKLIKLRDFVTAPNSEQRRHESDVEMEATGNVFKATLKGFTVGKGEQGSTWATGFLQVMSCIHGAKTTQDTVGVIV